MGVIKKIQGWSWECDNCNWTGQIFKTEDDAKHNYKKHRSKKHAWG